MKETRIYLLAGKARTGKDTAADIITKHYEKMGKSVVKFGFADYIKNYAMNVVNWDGSDKTKPRELLQIIGTDIVRNKINENFFINRVCEDIQVYKYFFDVIIISGGRFANELDIPKSKFKNVVIIKMDRPNFKSELSEKESEHITEYSLENYKNYDYLIENTGDEKDLAIKVKQIIEEVEA